MTYPEEQSDRGKQFYKKLKPIFFSKEVGFCPPCQIKQWAFVQWDIVQWAFVLVGFCPSGLLSVPRGGPRISGKGVYINKCVGIHFADLISIFLKYPMNMR